jgi:hypothetical protein
MVRAGSHAFAAATGIVRYGDQFDAHERG